MNVKTIKEFRKAGYKVHVDHRRLWKIAYIEPRNKSLVVKTVENTQGVMSRGGTPDENGVLYQLLPKGGRTEVTVTDPATGLDFYAYADCRSDENYNKRTGVEKCLERVAELVLVCSHHNEAKLDQFVTFIS